MLLDDGMKSPGKYKFYYPDKTTNLLKILTLLCLLFYPPLALKGRVFTE